MVNPGQRTRPRKARQRPKQPIGRTRPPCPVCPCPCLPLTLPLTLSPQRPDPPSKWFPHLASSETELKNSGLQKPTSIPAEGGDSGQVDHLTGQPPSRRIVNQWQTGPSGGIRDFLPTWNMNAPLVNCFITNTPSSDPSSVSRVPFQVTDSTLRN